MGCEFIELFRKVLFIDIDGVDLMDGNVFMGEIIEEFRGDWAVAFMDMKLKPG